MQFLEVDYPDQGGQFGMVAQVQGLEFVGRARGEEVSSLRASSTTR